MIPRVPVAAPPQARKLAPCSRRYSWRSAGAPLAGTGPDWSAGPLTVGGGDDDRFSPSPVELDRPTLPTVEAVPDAGGVGIDATKDADWTLVAYGREPPRETWRLHSVRRMGRWPDRAR